MHRHYGIISFAWFEGVVEDRQDPLKLGRVRVRAVGFHNMAKDQVPVEDLHWAQVIMPPTSASNTGVGETPNLVEGTFVVGFFRDAHNMQDPVIIGSINGIPQSPDYSKGFTDPREDRSGAPKLPDSIESPADGSGTTVQSQDPKRFPIDDFIDEPDTHRLAREDDQTKQIEFKRQLRETQTGISSASHSATNATNAGDSNNEGDSFDQPEVPYDAAYPYNQVKATESGHIFELDDTPDSERINIQHRTGTHREMHPDGTVTDVSSQDRYTVTHKNDREHVEGSQYVTIDKGQRVLINADEESDGVVVEVGSGGSYSITVNEGNCNLNVTGDLNIKVDGNKNEHITGNVTRLIEGNYEETINAPMFFKRTINAGQEVSYTISSGMTYTNTVSASQAITDTHNSSGTLTRSITSLQALNDNVTSSQGVLNHTINAGQGTLNQSVAAGQGVINYSMAAQLGAINHSIAAPQAAITQNVSSQAGAITQNVTTQAGAITHNVTTQAGAITQNVTTEGGALTRSWLTQTGVITDSLTAPLGAITQSFSAAAGIINTTYTATATNIAYGPGPVTILGAETMSLEAPIINLN